ncbi:HAMP domain-containing protein [Paenibacillaceae bacterium]|nr:HAMP domain-containing protein [Paenibacillaceae bacterium]
MNSFRVRLTLIIISLIGLSVLAAGLFMAKSFKDSQLDSLQDSMVREMKMIAASSVWESGEPEKLFSYFTEEARKIKLITGERVTFIQNDGTVLGDSDHDPHTMENHEQRIEVKQARKSGVGRDIRRSETTEANLMYVAIPWSIDDSQSGIIRLAMNLSQVEASIRQLWLVLLAGLLILFIITAAISYRIALGLTRPIEQISRVAKRIENLDYHARVSIKSSDEIGELGHSINAMAESLTNQLRRIRQNETQLESVLDNMINGIVMIDHNGIVALMNRRAEEVLGVPASSLTGRHYTEAKQRAQFIRFIEEGLESRTPRHDEISIHYPEERLLELNLVPVFQGREEFGGVLLVLQDVSAIRRLERMRSEFVANVSHELKTPIAAVKGFAETLLGGAVNDPETARSFLQIIYDESERLNRLIGDILELSKVESRRIPLQFSPIELSSFAAKTLEVLQSEAERKQITLEVKVEDGLYMEADEDRLRQVVLNLLSNGINYTPEGGRVSLVIEPAQSEAARQAALGGSTDPIGDDCDLMRFRISDTGIGIPRKDLPRIFERFYRVDKARSRSSGGTGLGLSIVKHLIELHEGTITVESTVGAGSTFVFELPIVQGMI